MSRGQLARTPENFPRMKHRARGRLLKKRANRQVGDVIEAFKAVGKMIGDYMTAAVNGFAAVAETVSKVFAAPPTQADFVLSNPPLLAPMAMTTRPQDWAPVARSMIWPREVR